ncbi:alpha/beta fold hydrolase [Tessaracoccus lubricantis]|uniref:Alpha/beta fold hydrolase n=1 Tax=Tessaracoccus lubricantis TaxID=545543 RepID=A0ABP9FDV1_9ACTN
MTAELNHLVIGSGEHTVVFLHGLFGQGKNFGTIATALSDVATSYLVDLPNHGRSPWTETFSLDNQAAEVAEWLHQSFDHPVTLIGHSLGGKIAMRIALQAPELVERLMVVDISPARNVEAAQFVNLVAALRTLDLSEVQSRTQADEALRELIPDTMVRRFLLQNLQHKGDVWFWLANLDLLADSLHAVGGWPAIDGEFDGPVLWVVGGRSPYCLPEHVEPMQALFPRVRQVTVKDAAHWVHADDPETFTSITRMFLTQD